MFVVKKSDSVQSTEGYHPRDYWTKVAREIEQRSSGNALAGDDTPFHRYKRAIFLMKFLDRVPIQGKTVLEVGCGPGDNLVRIAKRQPKKLVGCDISEGMVELARKNARDLEEVDIVSVDGTTLPFHDRSFDVTFTVTVLQHNHDAMLTKLLSEICRVTSDRLYLFEDTARTKQERFSCVLRPVSEYKGLCAAYGFELLETEPINLYVSYAASRVLRATFSRNRKEGEPMTKTHTLLESAVLPITKTFDKLVIQPRGLTKLVFERKS
jgi:ubiquinone/menaquinone biosynthesis C-methylase UbiE